MKKKIGLFSLLFLMGSIACIYFFRGKTGSLPIDLKESSNRMIGGQYDSAIFYAKKIIANSNSAYNQLYAFSIIGYSWFEQGELDSALFYYSKALTFESTTNPGLKASSLNMIGLILQEKQTHDKSIKYFRESISLYETINSKQLPIVYYNLAYNQSQTNNIECIESYYKALEYASDFKDLKYEAYCLSDLGNLMLETKNYNSAIEYFLASLDNEYAKNHPRRKAVALQGLGESEFYTRDYSSAKVHALEALKLKMENGYEEFLFTSYLLLGRIYRETNELEEAENNFKRAIIYYPYNERNKKNVAVFKELGDVELQLGKLKQSEYYNQIHFEELERQLDERKQAHNLKIIAI
ncbi:tetratricopeptide repeat protein [Reichenbachiella agarivorans]|uniref:Tetratricopeptide repeat protein n=1 Tax=Reichenbachiella agarivorans TaxID=2979464 RepID=A0ABY6CVW6_9BACT|nr:tetratricopeptide repeat protein [Reichenbachiella agarivorans]UXP32400.1 tetratricopeptide repeat protein [Reichenbachiella agarivorans]